jgi:hypothetical protein
MQSIRVFVRDGYRKLREQLLDSGIDGRRVREFGKREEANGQEWCAARDGRFNHREHAVGIPAHVAAIEGVRQIGLTSSG